MRLELVRDWMTRDLITISPESALPEAEEILQANDIRRLPVLQDGRLVGIITQNDVVRKRPFPAETVGQIMTITLVTVSSDATVGEAAQLLLKNKIGSLPVIDREGDLVGILTESDIFRLVVHDWIRASGDSTEPYAHYG